MTETCICARIPRRRLGMVFDKTGKLLHNFHLDCPQHGIVVLPETFPMERIVRRAWLNISEALAIRGREGAHVVEKAQDLKSALIEWIEWATVPEQEEETASAEV